MTPPPAAQDLLRRLIAAAFEAGLRAAPRAPADRAREKAAFQDYGEQMLAGYVEAAVAHGLERERRG